MRPVPCVVAVALLLAAPLVGCGNLEKDAAAFCRIAGEVVAEDSLAVENRGVELAKRFDAYGPGRTMWAIFEALGPLPPERRGAFVRASVSEELKKDWSCPAFDRLWEE